LIVEDDEDTAHYVSELLVDAGYDASLAANGVDGLEYLRTHGPPRMILLDLNMPVMDGKKMMRALQAEPKWRRIPVVLLTADPRAKDRAVELHAAGYLKKPFADLDLFAMIDSTLRSPS
jgi:CheY-like chemotaxis protein